MRKLDFRSFVCSSVHFPNIYQIPPENKERFINFLLEIWKVQKDSKEKCTWIFIDFFSESTYNIDNSIKKIYVTYQQIYQEQKRPL